MKNLKLTSLLIYFIVLIVVCLVYFNYAYQPMNQKTNNLNTQHAANVGQIATYDSYVRDITSIKANTDTLKNELATKNKAAPIFGAALEADVITGLSKAGILTPLQCQFGLETVSTNNVTSSDGKLLYSLPITLNFICTPAQLTTLLHHYEKDTLGAYYVNTITCTRIPKSDALINVNMIMAAYYFGSHPILANGDGK